HRSSSGACSRDVGRVEDVPGESGTEALTSVVRGTHPGRSVRGWPLLSAGGASGRPFGRHWYNARNNEYHEGGHNEELAWWSARGCGPQRRGQPIRVRRWRSGHDDGEHD